MLIENCGGFDGSQRHLGGVYVRASYIWDHLVGFSEGVGIDGSDVGKSGETRASLTIFLTSSIIAFQHGVFRVLVVLRTLKCRNTMKGETETGQVNTWWGPGNMAQSP